MGARYQSEPHPGSFGSARRTLGTLPSSLQCLLSAAPPPSPKSHSTCSGSFVVGVLINFILINSVISSCLQNRHQALLGDGSAEGAADTGFISPWALYISYGSERVGLGGKQKKRRLPAHFQCHLPNALCLPGPSLLMVTACRRTGSHRTGKLTQDLLLAYTEGPLLVVLGGSIGGAGD